MQLGLGWVCKEYVLAEACDKWLCKRVLAEPDPGAAATAHAMDLRNLEMEEYCPPPDILDLLEELKIPHHLDNLKELG
ncbi:hypothetical protein T492DRAFT_858888 [Pavlovales sp. CCMP2436]|nr:hypothetical protein T492DRAFT_858888 [Pavlovales sp. CCMP2436]